MVVETMMAKNREHRYQTPDDLILDLKCLQRGESPMIAGQKPETLLALAEGESDSDYAAAAAPSRGTTGRAGVVRQQPQSHHRDDRDAAGRLGDHQRDPVRRTLEQAPPVSPGSAKVHSDCACRGSSHGRQPRSEHAAHAATSARAR